MEYRTLGRTGLEVGVVGLGTEHLRREAETWDAVLGAAVDAGVRYVDLLYVEEDYWAAFGPVLRPHRKSLVLAAHWGSGPEYDLDFCRRTFENMLASVGNGYIEVALMTMIDDGGRKESAWREASLECLNRYREGGRVGWIGGSAHDAALALEAVESGLVDVLMFPVNMIGHDSEPDRALYRACAERGVGLVAMKPYAGGTLFTVNGRPSGITPAQCLDYVFSLPVATAVPGPKTIAEWRATLGYLQASEEERDHRPVVAELHRTMEGQCVYCHHCLPCPEEIEVGWMLWLLDQVVDRPTEEQRGWYAGYAVPASACVECGVCMERCPFGVDVVAKMRQAAALFEVASA
jgi:predicted aldo/keto reductase-like oxidoreductase